MTLHPQTTGECLRKDTTPALPIDFDLDAYDEYISRMREVEYESLPSQGAYLDHAGSTPCSRTALARFTTALASRLYGNPHSGSSAGSASSEAVDEARHALLRFVDADPAEFDVVFTANATAAIKLVGDAFREVPGGFWYGYHCEAHTSLVGLRELATETKCFAGDAEVEAWMDADHAQRGTGLFAYPAQSNMSGRRFPMQWADRSRRAWSSESSSKVYSLLDAAAYCSTARLDLSDASAAPDFTVLSLHKIFGFPDLGALIVRHSSAHVFNRIKYFGGGTVDMVVCLGGEQWHARKSGSLHARLEDGTLPFHSIIALNSAMQTFEELFGTLDRIAAHTARLAEDLYTKLAALRHGNGRGLCTFTSPVESRYTDTEAQGPIVAFNMRDSKGRWISNLEVEKLAAIKDIHLRTGGVCNPGGIATALGLAPWEVRENFSAGARCGVGQDTVNGKPTGVIRLSLGAMSTRKDVDRFVAFVSEFFVEKANRANEPLGLHNDTRYQSLLVESLTVYPIKSCGGFLIPSDRPWEIRAEGLAWDREWCLVHRGSNEALSQKKYPRMALLRPMLDFDAGVLRIGMVGRLDQISVPLSRDPKLYTTSDLSEASVTVCGDTANMHVYSSPAITEFCTKNLGIPCSLARFAASAARHSKAHLRAADKAMGTASLPLHLSNESPILVMHRVSLDAVNAKIAANGGKQAQASVFRANIVLGGDRTSSNADSIPGAWAEDSWGNLQIEGPNGPALNMLGGCRRCQMLCIDQQTAERNAEPFVTLAKLRRVNGMVLFGVHAALAQEQKSAFVKVGDAARATVRDKTEE